MAILVNPDRIEVKFEGGAALFFREMDTKEQAEYQKETAKCFAAGTKGVRFDAERSNKVKIAFAKKTCEDVQGFEYKDNGKVVNLTASRDDKKRIPDKFWLAAWTKIESMAQTSDDEDEIKSDFEEFIDPNG